MNTLGFIGMGQMAQALARGFLASGRIGRNEMAAYAPHQDKLRQNAERIGFRPVSSPEELARISDMVVMACKPYQIRDVLMNIGPLLPGKALISIAAGWDFAAYEASLPEGVRLQFVMPNTPAMVGEGVFLFEETNSLRPDERMEIMELFGAAGGIGGTYGAMPGLFLKMDALVRAGKYEEAAPIQHEVNAIISELCACKGNMYAVIKGVLKINEGLDLGSVRKPLIGLQPGDDGKVEIAAKHIRQAIQQFC